MRTARPRIVLALALTGLAGPASAEPLTAGTGASGCGGDAFSSAEIVGHRAPHRGPLVAVPETLCADVAPQPGTPSVQVDVYPLVTPQVGPGGGGIPYGERSVRPYRP